jgi:hypothetical protein
VLAFAAVGCGDELALVPEGQDAGVVVHYNSNEGELGVAAASLGALYDAWVDHELAIFRSVRAAMSEQGSFDQICARIESSIEPIGDVIRSIANLREGEYERPARPGFWARLRGAQQPHTGDAILNAWRARQSSAR